MSEVVRLYKFYDEVYGLQNVRQRRLKISTLDDLNDPFELRRFKLPSAASRKIWNRARTSLMSDKGIICFCKGWSNPVIWSHYANKHRGIALGFDVPKKLVVPVEYRKTRRKFPELSKQNPKTLMGLVKTGLATKYHHWRYENEVRLFAEAKEKCTQTGLFFKPFDYDLQLREVILGAESNLKSRDFLSDTGAEDLKVVTARLAFQSYRVVRQRLRVLQK